MEEGIFIRFLVSSIFYWIRSGRKYNSHRKHKSKC